MTFRLHLVIAKYLYYVGHPESDICMKSPMIHFYLAVRPERINFFFYRLRPYTIKNGNSLPNQIFRLIYGLEGLNDMILCKLHKVC